LISFSNIDLVALSAAVPAQKASFDDFAKAFGDRNVERIIESTGIRSVRIAGNLSTGDLCEAAANRLLAETGVAATDIDAVVVITQTPDDLMPGVAFKLQHKLGLRADCLAFDINQGCTGYIYGLLQASMLVKAGCTQVLLCTGDVTSKLLNASDRNVKMVFGDAATATLVRAGAGQLDFVMRSDGSGRDSLHTPISYEGGLDKSGTVGHLHMDGKDIMNFALTRVPSVIAELLDDAKVKRDEVDLVGFHQANAFMVKYLQKLINLSPSVVPVDMEQYGNTGPSSIPLLLACNGNKFLRRAQTILCGFGVGLSIGSVKLDLSTTKFISPAEVR
jgi:3-oxoacyl-[acyl-carrier-protein] synthase-3